MTTVAQHDLLERTAHQPTEPDWERGWRYETIQLVDGKEELVRIPLTDEEVLHPQEGYIMPERTYHETICRDLSDMLLMRYKDQVEMAVFHDLSFEWDKPDLKDHAPDIAIVPHVHDRDADREKFIVAEEKTRPLLIIEVVSPKTRNNDRSTKVKQYARAGVQEYLYIDHWTRKGQEIWEVVGFRLEEGQYVPLVPDEDGAIYCRSVGLRIGIENGKVWVEDAETGRDLLTPLAIQQALHVAEEARFGCSARIAELEAQMRALKGE
ncbi:MAG: Uma2 family endonuclease [Caldilinea sp. CFX5]|nr:Uma2 family endonuclease [Caldilinea sp. CFX5]